MAPIEIEVCVSADDPGRTEYDVRNAFVGGADRIELCANLSVGGTTPDRAAIARARSAFGGRAGLLVMIRPRDGDFAYAAPEIDTMCRSIALASDEGADGVVFGVLAGRQIDVDAMNVLLSVARAAGLATTFHRAFDDVEDRRAALDTLIELGVDRVLTSGTPWKSDLKATDGLSVVRDVTLSAAGRIEIVLGGGVRIDNASAIIAALQLASGRLSLHAHSSLLVDGVVSMERVAEFIEAVSRAQAVNDSP